MRLIHYAALVAAAATATTAWADSDFVIRAGEWQTSVAFNNRPGSAPHTTLVCHKEDRALTQTGLSGMLGRMGGHCDTPEITHGIGTVSFTVECAVGGGQMTVHVTATPEGPDAVSMHTIAHLEGGQMKLPDMDMSSASRRLGPCQPGDRTEPSPGGEARRAPG